MTQAEKSSHVIDIVRILGFNCVILFPNDNEKIGCYTNGVSIEEANLVLYRAADNMACGQFTPQELPL